MRKLLQTLSDYRNVLSLLIGVAIYHFDSELAKHLILGAT